ncbi:hypothetical protein ACP70R_007115 [Stipagrostis hirtigluma subsp. patula]
METSRGRRSLRQLEPFHRQLSVASVNYDITVDKEGLFHVFPESVFPDAPFRSFIEAAAAIKREHYPGSRVEACLNLYGESILLERLLRPQPPRSVDYFFTVKGGMFYIYPPDIGGPFQSLSTAMAAIEDYCTHPPRIPPLSTEFYFIMKDGLFHIHPDSLGGPFSRLDDATAAIQLYKTSYESLPDYEKERREKMRRMRKFPSKLHPADYRSCLVASETIYHPTEDMDSSTDDLESESCDPVVLEAIQIFESLVEKKEAARNGMKWMRNEAITAFKIFLSSIPIKGIKYKFGKLRRQCLICDGFPKFYHHYNFTMKIKIPSAKRWHYKRFFAEVKSTENGKCYFCCPLKPTDKGHCYGCLNVGIDIKHPSDGGYEEGDENSGFPFDTDDENDEYD